MTDHPLGTVNIGAREIYDKLVTVSASVDKVSEQLGNLSHDVGDHETRIRLLEKGRWPLPALAVVVSMASLALTIVPLIPPR